MAWDYTEKAYKKQALADPVWHLERLINGGAPRAKIDRKLLKKHFHHLRIPENRRAFFALLLWGKPF